MSKRQSIWTVLLLACAISRAWAQDSSMPPAETSSQSGQQEPVLEDGQEQENVPPPMNEIPQSGLDIPTLEPHAAPVGYIQPGTKFIESADSNAGNSLGSGSSFSSISRGLGSLTLKRLWSHYDLGLDYKGGAAYYSHRGLGWRTLQAMDVDQKIAWKRGQLSLRDSFSYLPEGNFGGAYGSLGSENIGLGNTPLGALLGGAVLGTLGVTPRIVNVSAVDVNEYLSPRSAVTAVAGYAFTHFFGNNTATGTPFIGVSQLSFEGGYSRILTPHTQLSAVYAYQGFDFSVLGSAFHTDVVEGVYEHRVSGRMDLLAGAGPQFTHIALPCSLVDIELGNPQCSQTPSGMIVGTVPQTRIGIAAIGRLRYRFTKTELILNYERHETTGSGLFAGAESDIARLSANRPLSRGWGGFVDLGFARNSRLQSLTTQALATCVPSGQTTNPKDLPPCPGVNANTYTYGFLGGGLHHAFGRNFQGSLSYQFTELSFDHSYCGGLAQCNRISGRQVISFGLEWIPRPIRID